MKKTTAILVLLFLVCTLKAQNKKDGGVWVTVTDSASSEFWGLSDGPFKGLSLRVGQKSPLCSVDPGELNFTLGSFKDTNDRKVILQSVITRLVTKGKGADSILNIVIHDADLTASEDLAQQVTLLPCNNTNIPISFVKGTFENITLGPGEKAKRKDKKTISAGFIPETIEFLDEKGIRVRIVVYKHIYPGCKYYQIDESDINVNTTTGADKTVQTKKTQTVVKKDIHNRR
ncbi:MAG: hypothetical protein NT165_01735 [Candidatus Falkowbacteria bacterium]|nr:hypothetical protein [Candidatus Falkowbacteria bacterium]